MKQSSAVYLDVFSVSLEDPHNFFFRLLFVLNSIKTRQQNNLLCFWCLEPAVKLIIFTEIYFNVGRKYPSRQSNRTWIDFNLEAYIFLIQWASFSWKFGRLSKNLNYSAFIALFTLRKNSKWIFSHWRNTAMQFILEWFGILYSEKRLFLPGTLDLVVMGLLDSLIISMTYTLICAYLKHRRREHGRDQILIFIGRS